MNFLLVASPSEPNSSPTPVTPNLPPVPLWVGQSDDQISSFIKTLVIALFVAGLVYVIMFYVLRLILRRLEKEVAIVALNISQLPILAIVILLGVKISIQQLGSGGILQWIERGLTALVVLAVSYWVTQLFTQVLAYYLKKYSEKSEATWDDVLIPILEGAFPVIIYLVGGFFFLQAFGFDLTGLFVALGGITFVLGFALKNILSNFFSGLVLLIDTPFQFGDVISLENGSIAIIKKVGLRVTNLFLIDNNCELFIPNGSLQRQKIINLSRPTPHYYYSIHIPLRGDTEAERAIKIMREVALAHPDTLGNIDEKLQLIDAYYKLTSDDKSTKFNTAKLSKKEAGRERLLAERDLNNQLEKIQQLLGDLVEKIQIVEKGGLDTEEIRKIQSYYLDTLKLIGLEVVTERQGKRRSSWLEEGQELENTLIGLARIWYKVGAKDPDLAEQDPYDLQEEWERKIGLLKVKLNRLFQKISQPKVDERKLDDYVMDFAKWLDERFKTTKTVWQEPKAWMVSFKDAGGSGVLTSMEYVVKFYVDNIKLERCQRGDRIKSEVQGEMIRQLRKAYIYR